MRAYTQFIACLLIGLLSFTSLISCTSSIQPTGMDRQEGIQNDMLEEEDEEVLPPARAEIQAMPFHSIVRVAFSIGIHAGILTCTIFDLEDSYRAGYGAALRGACLGASIASALALYERTLTIQHCYLHGRELDGRVRQRMNNVTTFLIAGGAGYGAVLGDSLAMLGGNLVNYFRD